MILVVGYSAGMQLARACKRRRRRRRMSEQRPGRLCMDRWNVRSQPAILETQTLAPGSLALDRWKGANVSMDGWLPCFK